ncbi:hypothetical protein OOZ63_25980 [Paucibacter sp. PLA-PC-4]|uniref:hypothetical protein n=1 Tax=Paucibacter sp. PLA-PC-4 TaxID=2993655 RepID=UPI00224A7F62|nr:hypothetical protein [Paucibacter sp. PLA-PC-4]MCX2865282.1 hypothetical protein [Paucibacter sp. PLA-PC-4]
MKRMPSLPMIAVLATAVLLALFSGLILPVAGVIPLVALWALPAALVIVFYPQAFYWMMLALVLLVSGTVQYFTDHGQLQWVASGIGVCLLVSGFLRGASAGNGVQRVTAIDASLMVFAITATVSTVFGEGGAGHLAAGLRTYLPFLGLYAYIRLGGLQAVTLRRTVWFLLVVALLQWPVELYQAMVIVPQRAAMSQVGSAFDSVVGTFGGPRFGGGASGSLAIYLVFGMALTLALYRNALLTGKVTALCLLALLVGIGLAETKVVFVLIPVALAMLYLDELYRRPIRFLVGSLFALGVLALLLYFYFIFFWEAENRGNVWLVIVRRFSYSFDPDFMPAYNWPGRMTGLFIWGRNQDFSGDVYHWLVGYGVAAATSQSTIAGPGVAALKFGLGTDVTGATKLLWEVGLIGTLAYVAPLFLAFVSFGRVLRERAFDPLLRAFIEALRASTPVLALGVLYEVTIVSSPTMQLLAMILYAVAARLELPRLACEPRSLRSVHA